MPSTTTWSLRNLALVVLGLVLQPGIASGQTVAEWQVQAVGTVLAARFIGGGVGVAARPAGRLRAGLSVSVGGEEGEVAGRGELLVSFHLDPLRRRGVSPYLGGGAAVEMTDERVREYVLVVLGVESSPGGRMGWFFESGVGGGVRISAGIRMRGLRRRGR